MEPINKLDALHEARECVEAVKESTEKLAYALKRAGQPVDLWDEVATELPLLEAKLSELIDETQTDIANEADAAEAEAEVDEDEDEEEQNDAA